MKICVILPIITETFNQDVEEEIKHFKAPDMEIEIVNLGRGPQSIESYYDEMVASYEIVEKVIHAQKKGFDGVFIDCFGDPAVDAAREMVKIPVVGGFQPAALTASLLARKWSCITILKNVIPKITENARKLGIENNIASIRSIDMPVLNLLDKVKLKERLLDNIEKSMCEDGAEAVVLGCTGMLGLAKKLSTELAERGYRLPVVDPTASAIGYLELLVRSGLSHSSLTYPYPPEKIRRFP